MLFTRLTGHPHSLNQNSASGEKKFAVVRFLPMDNVEVIPISWLISEDIGRWPSRKSTMYVTRCIKEAKEPEEDWESLKLKVVCRTKTFKKADEKAKEALGTSNVSSNSSSEEDSRERRKKKPARYYSSEEEFPIRQHTVRKQAQKQAIRCPSGEATAPQQKQFYPPLLPCNKGQNRRSPIIIDSSLNEDFDFSQSLISAPKQCKSSLLKSPSENFGISQTSSALRPFGNSTMKSLSNENMDFSENFNSGSMLNQNSLASKQKVESDKETRLFTLMTKIFDSLQTIQRDIKELKQNQLRLFEQTSAVKDDEGTVLLELPKGVDLPISSDEALHQLDDKLKRDKHLQSVLIRYFDCICSGKTMSAFLLSLCRHLLTREVAIQYSRLGRKGKKNFEQLSAVTSTILAASSKRFKDASRQDLAEKFGRVLATAGEWDRKKTTNPGVAENSLFLETNDCIDQLFE